MKTRLPSTKWQYMVILLLYIHNGAVKGASDCENGISLPDGTCDCYSCFHGDSCSEYASRPPKFPFDADSVTLTEAHLGGKPLYKAMAVDPDEEYCKDPEGCPCSTVTYFIASQDRDANFQIDKSTGEVTVTGESYALHPTYELVIGASDDGAAYDTMTLTIHSQPSRSGYDSNKFMLDVSDGYLGAENVMDFTGSDGEELLSRHRRAVVLPSNVTFDLKKYGVNQNEASIKVGMRIQFELNILFPSGSTDMQVELFAPDSDNIIMMLCDVTVTVGSNLAITGTSVPVMESLDNSDRMDRAIISLGTVTNSEGDLSTNDPSTITVLYEAVMVDNALTVNGAEYWVSAGAEYNNENDVWVGQASFTADTAAETVTASTIPANFTGPSNMQIGTSAVFQIDMEINYAFQPLKFNFFAPVNVTDVMTICDAKVTGVNEAYQCTFPELWSFEPVFLANGNTQGYGRVEIDLGSPINKLAYDYKNSGSDSTYSGILSFAVVVSLNEDEALVSNTYVLGATMEIGTQVIWAGQIQVTADPLTSDAVVPIFNTSFVNGDTISQTTPVVIQLDMEVPAGTKANYVLEVMAPFKDDLAIFQVCNVRVESVGDDMACVLQREYVPEYTISSNNTDSIYPDVARVNLGPISNPGSSGWTHPNSTGSPNVVSFRILFKATDHPDAVDGSSHDVFFGMFIGDSRLSVGRMTVNVGPAAPADNITIANTPLWAMSFGGDGSDTVPIGRTVKALLDIRTDRNTIYQPFNIEFIMPNNSGEAMMKICKVELQSAGLNTPCVVKEGVERAVQMISSFGDGLIDRAVINLPSLCNFEQVDDINEDRVVLAVSVILRDHPQFLVDPKTWISAGVMYSNVNLWVGQLAVNADLAASGASLSQTPYFGAVDNNAGLTAIPLGYSARYLLRIKISPNDTTPLSLNISTTDDALSICTVLFVRAGDGYPCTEADSAEPVLFDVDNALGINRKGSLDLLSVTNVGFDLFVADDSFDTNTIEVEVVVKLSSDPALAPDASMHTFEAVLNYDTNYASALTATATVTATFDHSAVNDSTTLATSSIVGTVNVGSITGNDTGPSTEILNEIVLGESKRIVVSVETVLNSTSYFQVTVATPLALPDIMEVQYIGIQDAGENLPCVSAAQTVATYEPRNVGGAYNDIATLDLSYVCNVGAVKNDTEGTANRVRVEALVRLFPNAAVNTGDTLQLSAAINSNGQEIYVQTFSFTVGDVSTYEDVYNENITMDDGVVFNSTENPIIMAIADYKVFPIVFRVPSFTSSKVWLDADMPVNTSAILTIDSVQLTRSGRNIPGLEKFTDLYEETMGSHHNTSQMTKYELNFGVISNGGMSHHTGTYESDDDTFSMDITLRMADNEMATDLSEHKVSFGLHVSKFIFILDVTVTVSRTGSEFLEFNVSSTWDEVNSTLDHIVVDTIFRLSDMSTREGGDSILNIFLPPYAAYISTVVNSPYKEILATTNENNAITLSFGPLFFTDEVHLTTVLESNATYFVPLGITGLDSVFKFQPIANTDNQTDIAGDIDYVNFTITTTPQGGSDCTPGPLGLQDGTIKDCQISSSEDSIIGSEAINGRYGGAGWSPFVHYGKVKEERYFQVYFGNKVMVNKIKLQQSGAAKATRLNIRYSNDGMSWIESTSNELYPTGVADEDLDIPAPQISRYIRVMITDLNDNNQIAKLAFEFVGCATSTDGPADPCTAVHTEPTKLADFSRRSFVYAGTAVYVCDGIKGTKGIEQKCYASSDDQTWRALDSRVGSMLGYDSEEPRIYAVSSTGLHYMSSVDGVEWFSSVPADVTKAKALITYKPAIEVPVNGDARLLGGNPDAAFIDTTYGATSLGLKVNTGAWDLIFVWSTCC